MRVVLDTNVLVSAMLSAGGLPDTVLQLVLQGSLTLLVDSRILAEYREVTARPRFAFDEREHMALLDILGEIAELVPAQPLRISFPDPDDRMFVEVAMAGRADVIVTGNVRHFVPRGRKPGVRVLTPREVVDILRR